MEYPVNIDIIILSYALNDDLRKLTEQCVNSLISSEDQKKVSFNILILESNKNLSPFQYDRTLTIYPKEKFGYNRYMNIGISLTSNPFICLCNNDLIFHKNWATEILNAFTLYPDLSSASPACSILHPKIGISLNEGLKFGYQSRREISGWCIFFKRSILKTTGLLDERFNFWFSDDDYGSTLQKYNLKHALVTGSIVDHLESQTLQTHSKAKQARLTSRERFYYEYKWGKRSYLSYLNGLRKFYREIWLKRD